MVFNRNPKHHSDRRFLRNEAGVAFIEFALILPLLMLVFYGVIEVSRYIQMHQKVDNASHALTDMINQNLNVTHDSIQNYMRTVPSMVTPFDAQGVGVIVTSIKVPEATTTPTTLWQIGSGDERSGSRVSTGKGAIPQLGDLTLIERDQIITVEIFLHYRPLMDNTVVRSILGLSSEGVYKVTYAKPRFGAFEFEPI